MYPVDGRKQSTMIQTLCVCRVCFRAVLVILGVSALRLRLLSLVLVGERVKTLSGKETRCMVRVRSFIDSCCVLWISAPVWDDLVELLCVHFGLWSWDLMLALPRTFAGFSGALPCSRGWFDDCFLSRPAPPVLLFYFADGLPAVLGGCTHRHLRHNPRPRGVASGIRRFGGRDQVLEGGGNWLWVLLFFFFFCRFDWWWFA